MILWSWSGGGRTRSAAGRVGRSSGRKRRLGTERISDNRYREAEGRLEGHGEDKVLAVGCPFCKSMLESTPGKGEAGIAVKDVAELMLESVLRRAGESVVAGAVVARVAVVEAPVEVVKRARWWSEGCGGGCGCGGDAGGWDAGGGAEEVGAEGGCGGSGEGGLSRCRRAVVEAGAPVAGEAAGPAPVRKKWEPKKGGKPPEARGVSRVGAALVDIVRVVAMSFYFQWVRLKIFESCGAVGDCLPIG